ncbi:hypothetical protein L6164_026790 [Bauhinia variegata]|uniref:Uncharacterized protein n=1 Tax=Bauhinia variegata TaxID=167791 RepID=A0ACB9LS79_BAUVA|nr:hypothetical protein L6164_026790 [Bauhinia variegata]
MHDAMASKFDCKALSANPIRIADLGCSKGPNTNIAMQYITEAIKLQYHSQEDSSFCSSSSSLSWISEIPKEIADSNSAAYKKGRIHCGNAPKEVVEAYATQYQEDVEAFLYAREQELVAHVLMVLHIPVAAEIMLDSDIASSKMFELLGSCLMDMVKEATKLDIWFRNLKIKIIY